MTETVDVVALLRAKLIELLQWAGPEAMDAVLRRVATVPYRGDVHRYLAEAMPVATATLMTAVQPRLDALNVDAAAYRAQADEMEARHAKFMREFEKFRHMVTSKIIH